MITVLYFAAVRDLIGIDEERIELPSDVTTLRSFAAHLATRHPVLTGRLASCRIARNECFAAEDERLAAGDILAVIPPVAGGA